MDASDRKPCLAFLLIILLAVPLLRMRADGPSSTELPATVHPLKAPGIDNFYQLSDRFYSGSAPEGDTAFADLQKRGIKTIITVDGAKPDVDTARRFGIRYVHLPIGYDGVPSAQALRLVKAAKTIPGPIYIHCHHGLHRGPAGAAVICMALEGWKPDQAEAWLHRAGTSTNYPGLYRSVEKFIPPTDEVLRKVPNNFPAKSPVSPLADVMIQVDGRMDNLKLIQKAGYRTPSNHPDLDPAQEALLLDELFRELLRSQTVEHRPADFKSKLTEAERAAGVVHQSLLSGGVGRVTDAAFQKLNDDCTACHKIYRN